MAVDVRYVAGSGVLLGAGTTWLLLDDAPDPAFVEELWALLDPPGRAADRLLQALERHYEEVPSAVIVDVTPGSESSVISGRGRVTNDGDTRRLSVGLPVDGPTSPLAAGVVAAAGAVVTASVSTPSPAEPIAPDRTGLPVPPVPEGADLIDGIPPEILAASPCPAPPDEAARPVDQPDHQPVEPPQPVAAVTDPDHDGSTIHRRAAPTAQAPDEADHLRQSTHETVLAARCPAGHLTAAFSPTCRVCHQPVPPQEPERVPRPKLGTLRLPTGDGVPLDRGVVFGRKPVVPDGSDDWPHLVRLPQDSTYLSRMHLRVELDGWLVLARDLGSRGGTVLRAPGRPPERIRAGEPYVLEPGHVLDLAEDYQIEFEVGAE